MDILCTYYGQDSMAKFVQIFDQLVQTSGIFKSTELFEIVNKVIKFSFTIYIIHGT